MKIKREFDCIEFKRQCQADFTQKYADLSPEETAKQVRDWVEHSDVPIAQWWRKAKALAAAEDP